MSKFIRPTDPVKYAKAYMAARDIYDEKGNYQKTEYFNVTDEQSIPGIRKNRKMKIDSVVPDSIYARYSLLKRKKKK